MARTSRSRQNYRYGGGRVVGNLAYDERYAERRAAREGASFEIIPAAMLDQEMDRLAEISAHWLQGLLLRALRRVLPRGC